MYSKFLVSLFDHTHTVVKLVEKRSLTDHYYELPYTYVCMHTTAIIIYM